jgi:ferredoxin
MTQEVKTIESSQMSAWVGRLLEKAEVIAPTAARGETFFLPISSAEQVAWETPRINSLIPPKEFLFPQREALFTSRRENGRYRLEAVSDERERVFLGIRSCDARGISFLDAVFSRDLPDSYYLNRRQRATLISLVCAQPEDNCFCICTGGGPSLEEGFDLQLTRVDDVFVAEVGSEKGRSLVREASDLFREASAGEREAAAAVARESRDRFGEATAYLISATRRVSARRVPEALWEEMSHWCLECGGCNYTCPVCYCFNVQDCAAGDTCTRFRTWDSCQYEGYAREASGHNPREKHWERVRRRFYHKLSYQYRLKEGDYGCVGCGRCVTVCLGHTTMPAVVKAIRRGEWT